MEEPISKRLQKLIVHPIVPLEFSDKEDLDLSKHVDHMCHNTPSGTNLKECKIKITALPLVLRKRVHLCGSSP